MPFANDLGLTPINLTYVYSNKYLQGCQIVFAVTDFTKKHVCTYDTPRGFWQFPNFGGILNSETPVSPRPRTPLH